jgi:hypothetical protein
VPGKRGRLGLDAELVTLGFSGNKLLQRLIDGSRTPISQEIPQLNLLLVPQAAENNSAGRVVDRIRGVAWSPGAQHQQIAARAEAGTSEFLRRWSSKFRLLRMWTPADGP